MRTTSRSMHVARIVRKYKNSVYVTSLLRRSYREGSSVKHETLANLSHLPDHIIDLIRRSLQGEEFCLANELFHPQRSLPHGHVEAVLGTIRKIGLDNIIASVRSRERELVVAMIAERILFPCSKLATTRHWHSTTLAEELQVADADHDDLYEAMDWLLQRQEAIENKLASRHLAEDGLVLYDVSSSYYEGHNCPLARHGHSRDGKKGLPIIVYGLLTDKDGRPVSVDVYPGNTADPTTVPDQVTKLRTRFGLERVVLVGDRGMLTETQIGHLRKHPGLGWISALRSKAILKMIEDDEIQRSLFDEVDLAEITSSEFPGERLVACYNPLLADQRGAKRQALLAKTEKTLVALANQVNRRTKKPMKQAEIALKAGRNINRWKMAKHFQLTIADGVFQWKRREERIAKEKMMDGIYVIRTCETKEAMSAEDCVRNYKKLSQVEQGFRSLKSVDLMVRPIHHRISQRVRAHIFLCMLAYYVQWHLRKALKPLLFDDENLEKLRATRDPVKPAQPTKSAKLKKKKGENSEGFPIRSFAELMQELATRTRITCQINDPDSSHTVQVLTETTALQARAFSLLGL